MKIEFDTKTLTPQEAAHIFDLLLKHVPCKVLLQVDKGIQRFWVNSCDIWDEKACTIIAGRMIES